MISAPTDPGRRYRLRSGLWQDSMHRFVYHTRDSFFHVGRGRRDTLVKEYGRLDPRIADIVLDEMRANWWRHLLVSIPPGVVRHVGRVVVESSPGPAVWMGVCACCPAVAACVYRKLKSARNRNEVRQGSGAI